jgi:hypothetical protein
MQVNRRYKIVPSHLACIPDNFRRDAKELDVTIPATTTDVDILEVWYSGSSLSWSDREILSAISAGAVALGREGSYFWPVDKNGKQIDNW